MKDWRDNLSSLLLFAAIFAAVLTAFIIESKKMLEQDQTELLVGVTLFSINNMGNASNLPFTPPDFEPTSAAISINCLLFSSLGTSLIAALAAVVSLQWVADYDAAITRGAPHRKIVLNAASSILPELSTGRWRDSSQASLCYSTSQSHSSGSGPLNGCICSILPSATLWRVEPLWL